MVFNLCSLEVDTKHPYRALKLPNTQHIDKNTLTKHTSLFTLLYKL